MSTQRYNHHWLPQYLEPGTGRQEDLWGYKDDSLLKVYVT